MSFLRDSGLGELDQLIDRVVEEIEVTGECCDFHEIGVAIRTTLTKDDSTVRGDQLDLILDRTDYPPRLADRIASLLSPSISEAANGLLAMRHTRLMLQVLVAIQLMLDGYDLT